MASRPPYYLAGAQSGRAHSDPPNDSSFDAAGFPNRVPQPWLSSNEQSFPSSAVYHPSSPQTYYDAQPDARTQQLRSSDPSTAFGFTQHPQSVGGQDVFPQNHYQYHTGPHLPSGSNNSSAPFAEPQSGPFWTNARANPTPFGHDGPVFPSANGWHDQRAAMMPHGGDGVPSSYPMNISAPTNHIYPPAGASSSGSAANPIWRRGRDEAAIADRRKADAQFDCHDPYCTANFTTKGACKKHWESKHQGRRFPCFVEGCDKEYADESSRGRHVRQNHGSTSTR